MNLGNQVTGKLNALENAAQQLPNLLFPVKLFYWAILIIALLITNIMALLHWPYAAIIKRKNSHQGKLGATVEVTSEAQLKALIESEKLVLVDFWAQWCGPCLLMNQTVDLVARELAGQVVVAKVDVSLNSALSNSFNVKGLPTFLVYKLGQEVARKPGALTKQALISLTSDIDNAVLTRT